MPRNTYTGPLPTIGYTRAQGVGRIRVYCIQGCGHAGMVEIDRPGMPNDLPFVHIPAQQRLVCMSGGGRNVQVMPDWRRVLAGRIRSGDRARPAPAGLFCFGRYEVVKCDLHTLGGRCRMVPAANCGGAIIDPCDGVRRDAGLLSQIPTNSSPNLRIMEIIFCGPSLRRLTLLKSRETRDMARGKIEV
jgi:hypothetical protein